MDTLKKDMGKRLEEIRGSLHLTQEEMGCKLGKGKGSISKYENGDAAPQLDTLVKYVELGGVSFDWIFTGKSQTIDQEKKPEITYPLTETENNALHTAENIIERFGLDNRFQIAEIQGTPIQVEAMTDNEKRLFTAFRSLDTRRQERLMEDAEDMVLARKESHEKGNMGGGLMDLNCA